MATCCGGVPLPKLVYGSDGSEFPEILWYYARAAKSAMAGALSELVDAGVFTVEEALQQGANIFHDNARTLFGLQPSGDGG